MSLPGLIFSFFLRNDFICGLKLRHFIWLDELTGSSDYRIPPGPAPETIGTIFKRVANEAVKSFELF